jgi:3D (Asp-Asp-Asp) domain-containing protein
MKGKRIAPEWVAKRLIILFISFFVFILTSSYNAGQKAAEVKIEPIKHNETTKEKEQPLQVQPEQPKSIGKFILSAYCDCESCCGKSDGITATGTKAMQGITIAVDPNVIPYGTEVIINGHTYIAQDCGGAIKGNRIDIYFDSHYEALQFGVQTAEVYVKE